MQIGGWGNRSPFSKRSGISRVGIPSYGFPPKVISSQIVTPRRKRRMLIFEVILLRLLPNFLQVGIVAQFWTAISSLPGPVKILKFGLPFNKHQKMVKWNLLLSYKSNFPHFYWHKKQHDRSEAQQKGLRQINTGKVNGCNIKRMYLALLSYQKGKWIADVLCYSKGKKRRCSLTQSINFSQRYSTE